MPSISGNVAVAANTRSGNLIAGDLYEFMPSTGTVALYMTGSAAGLEVDISIGGRTIAQAFVVPGTNRFPLREEDGVTVVRAAAGQRIFLDSLNTTAGPLTANWLIDIF